MPQYSDSTLKLSNHRLQSYDIGYYLAPLIALISRKPNNLNFQSRRAIQRVVDAITRSNQTINLVYCCSDFPELPLVISYFIEDDRRVRFFLGQKVGNSVINEFTRALSEKIVHFTTEDHVELFGKLGEIGGRTILMIDGHVSNDVRLAINILPHIECLTTIILNYCDTKSDSFYFEARKQGLTLIENADGSGEIFFY